MLDYDELHRLFEYRNGLLIRKVTVNCHARKGAVLGETKNTGYARVRIDGVPHNLHRIIFMMHHGRMPKTIDHIDGNQFNNKIDNLRECSISENMFNSIRPSSNKSGVKGVFWHKHLERWYVSLCVKGKSKYIGVFKDLEKAKYAIEKHRGEFHGSFTNDG